MPEKIYPADFVAAVRKDYIDGMAVEKIKKKYRIHRNTMRRLVADLPPRKHFAGPTREELIEAHKWYMAEDSRTLVDVENKYGWNHHTVAERFRRVGLPRKLPGGASGTVANEHRLQKLKEARENYGRIEYESIVSLEGARKHFAALEERRRRRLKAEGWEITAIYERIQRRLRLIGRSHLERNSKR